MPNDDFGLSAVVSRQLQTRNGLTVKLPKSVLSGAGLTRLLGMDSRYCDGVTLGTAQAAGRKSPEIRLSIEESSEHVIVRATPTGNTSDGYGSRMSPHTLRSLLLRAVESALNGQTLESFSRPRPREA